MARAAGQPPAEKGGIPPPVSQQDLREDHGQFSAVP
jgi:hypothetical protein